MGAEQGKDIPYRVGTEAVSVYQVLYAGWGDGNLGSVWESGKR